MEWQYITIPCKKVIEITSLVSVQYMDFSKNFTFPLEQHKCWEFNFHDFGETKVYAGGQDYLIKKNEMLLYSPMVEHGITHRTEEVSNTISIAFESDSPALYRLALRVIPMSPDLLKQLGRIMKLATYFSERGIPSGHLLHPIEDELTEKETIVLQLITNLLEEFFLRLLDAEDTPVPLERLPKLPAENRQINLSAAVQDYIEDNLEKKMTLQSISQHFNVSVSKLCRDIKATTNSSLQELISKKRLKAAKRMIRQEEFSFTEVAERLGFSSLHYFSQWFKKQTNRSPSEYATSVKGRGED